MAMFRNLNLVGTTINQGLNRAYLSLCSEYLLSHLQRSCGVFPVHHNNSARVLPVSSVREHQKDYTLESIKV